MPTLEAAIRLRKNDVLRLSALHRRQFALSIANGDDGRALDLIEGGEEDGEHGLVYVRVAGPSGETYEGFLLDIGQYPMKEARPDGGIFFRVGTTEPAGFEMSQSCFVARKGLPGPLAEELKALLAAFPVKVSGPALKTNPPFEHATVPKTPKPRKPKKGEIEPLALEVVSARRYTEADLRAASPEVQFQCSHAFRPKFAAKTVGGGMESMILTSVDPGPESDKDFLPPNRSGMFHVHLRVEGEPARTFDGWFRDERNEDPEAWWPSRRARATSGRLLKGGTIEPALVTVENGKVVPDKDKATLEAYGLAEGLKKLGLAFEVEVVGDTKKPGYFASKHHVKWLDPETVARIRAKAGPHPQAGPRA